MVTPNPPGDRGKVVSKLPSGLKQALKVRTAEFDIDMQDAVGEAVDRWLSSAEEHALVDTAGAVTFSTFLLPEQWGGLKDACAARGIPFVQGLAQAVALWLAEHPSPRHRPVRMVRRIIVCNQKGGVGKTAVSSGLGGALAEGPEHVEALNRLLREEEPVASGRAAAEAFAVHGLRVLLVDFDPQGHLTKQLGFRQPPRTADSLTKFMSGGQSCRGVIADLVVKVPGDRFGGRLDLLPSCADAFLLDISIVMDRNRQATLERALRPLEPLYDAIIIDCPPSLGLGMDAAIYYSRRRDGEKEGNSGCLIVVQAEDSSADAYSMLSEQIESGETDWDINVDRLGLVVNLYDGRRGYIATSSLKAWREIEDPRVVGIIPDLKEQREAVRAKTHLFSYAPHQDQAIALRRTAGEIT